MELEDRKRREDREHQLQMMRLALGHIQQEDHDGPISLTWPNRFAYLLLKFQPSSLL